MLTRIIYPLTFREKLSWRIREICRILDDKNISLEFNKKVKLDLTKTDIGHQSIILNGFYELSLSKELVKLGTKGGLLIDVGANFGYFSCLWASLNPDNRVVAFEASSANLVPFTNNVSKNGFSNSIMIIPIAAGKEKGKLKFNLANETGQTGWGGISIDNHPNLAEVEVDTLDNFTANKGISRIDVLKVDTEGADTWVLYGAERLLKERRIQHIFFEHNRERMKLLSITETEAINFLNKLDYTIEKRSANDFYAYPNRTGKS